MALKVDEKFTKDINSIMAELPANNWIIGVIGDALEVRYNNPVEGDDFEEILEMTKQVTKFVSKISSSTSYKFHVILSLLLAGVPYEKYESLDNANGTIRNAVELMTNFAYNKGWKDGWIQLNNIAKNDMDLLYVALVMLCRNAEKLVKAGNERKLTAAESYMLAGMAYLEVSLRKSAITVPNVQYELYNHFMNLMMKQAQF